MDRDYIKIEITPKIQNIAPARVGITSYISNLDIHVDELMDIKTALSEAITNAVEHAYDKIDENSKVIVECNIVDKEKIVIDITDFGKGIEDISLAMTPAYTSRPEDEHAGMGFTIMESFMDEIVVDSKVDFGTKVTLTKNIRKKKSK